MGTPLRAVNYAGTGSRTGLFWAGLAAQHCRGGHAFAECGSPVCLPKMPLDNRTVDQFEASPSRLASSSLFETLPQVKRSNISSRRIVL
jgi:hypothetical protein